MHEEPKGKKNLAYKPLFIKRLQNLKVENNTTSEQLANFLKMPLEYYTSNVEMPDKYISWTIVCRIANYFNVQQDYLYGYTNHPNDEFYDTDIFIYQNK